MATMGVVFQIDDYSIGAVQTAHGPHSATRDLPLLRIAVLKERNKKLSGLRCRFKWIVGGTQLVVCWHKLG